ncbi:MAG: AI-2E family transporter [Candidatus Sulfotelmatobacter sp.]
MVRAKEVSASSKSLTVIALVLAITALYVGRAVFIPLALALVLSFLLTPFVVLLEKIRFGRVPSVITVVTVSLVLIGVATWGVAGQLVQIMAQLPDYKANLDTKIQSLHVSKVGNLSKATATVQELNKELAAAPGQVTGRAQPKDQGTARSIRPIPVQVAPPASSLAEHLGQLLGPLTGPLETAVIVIIFTMFMLVKREDLRNRAIRLAGRGQLSVMTQAFDDASSRLSRFLLLQCLVNTAYGSLFGLGLYFIRVPHALLWGFVAGFLRFVPYIGSFAAAAFPIAMAIAVFPGWRQAGIVFGVFLALELIISNVVEPLLYGANTGISSLAILVASVFWATIWGPVGLILSTPLTVCLVVLGRYVPQLNFLEVVLGDEPALPLEQLFYQRLLAADQEEARSIAEIYLKDHPIEGLYETIIIPALRLAEQDYYVDALDDDTRRFILRATRELIEDVCDRLAEDLSSTNADENGDQQSEPSAFAESYANIGCIPVRGGADELVAIMLAQLLRSQGFRALHLRSAAIDEMVAEISQQGFTTVCVSCLPPFASASARSLCRRLKASSPGVRIIMGVWHLEGGVSAARSRLGTGCPDLVLTTLAEALSEVHRLATPGSVVESPTEKR